MYHQPFETWILEDKMLSTEEKQTFSQHMETCCQCRILQDSWQAAQAKLSTAKMISPQAGFSTRWQQTLKNRVEEQKMKQVLQVRRFFLYLGAANILSLITLSVLFITGGSSLNIFANAASRIATFTIWFDRLEGWFFTLLNISSPVLPVIVWVILTSLFSILALIWVVSLWRITFQGAKLR